MTLFLNWHAFGGTAICRAAELLLLRQGGEFPYSTLIFDTAGNLYGTTSLGTAHNSGAVFELTPHAGGGWTENVPHVFGGRNDGQQSFAGAIFDAVGNLYGTTGTGGPYGNGTVFELMGRKRVRANSGSRRGWKEEILAYLQQ